jgi:hypothetical protein
MNVKINYASTLQQYSGDIPAATKRVLTINGSGDIYVKIDLQREYVMKFIVQSFSKQFLCTQAIYYWTGLVRAT